MRILFVEDDPDWVQILVAEIDRIAPHADVIVAEHRDQALAALDAGGYDLIICDLKIPPDGSSVEPDEVHGVAVLDFIEQVAAGTRVVVLSGFGTLAILQPYLARGTQVDYFGSGTLWFMRDHYVKGEVDRFVDELRTFAGELREIENIELTGAVEADLSNDDIRVLRTFARRHDGTTIDVKPLGGARSGANALRIEVRNAADTRTCLAVAKIGDRAEVFDEQQRYFARVAPLLRLGTYTPHSGDVAFGTPNRGGVFYTLADGYDTSLFDLLRDDPREAAGTVAKLEANLEAWHANATPKTVNLVELRRPHAPDEILQIPEIADLPCAAEEARSVHIRAASGHADLHGGNVLVDDRGQPVVIDFGRAAEVMNPFDPVTLELSTLCHPDAALSLDDWPSSEQWGAWFDVDRFVAGSPIEPYVRACREWAQRVKRGDRELLACAYIYLMRQLKYDTVPAAVIADGVAGVLSELSAR